MSELVLSLTKNTSEYEEHLQLFFDHTSRNMRYIHFDIGQNDNLKLSLISKSISYEQLIITRKKLTYAYLLLKYLKSSARIDFFINLNEKTNGVPDFNYLFDLYRSLIIKNNHLKLIHNLLSLKIIAYYYNNITLQKTITLYDDLKKLWIDQ